MPEQPPDRASLDQLMESIEADDAERARLLLDRDPDVRARINEPIGPFDSPPLAGARSRAMIDVLLAAGADINARSQWWAGGFGYLHTADPELAAYAIERGAVVDVHAAARLGHLEKPYSRATTSCAPLRVKRDAWIWRADDPASRG